jgi:hypothetical protein
MFQWRKFEFFEEKAAGRGAVPSEIAARVTCCSGGRGRVAVGCDDGTVGLLDRGFRLSYGFQAYASSVLLLKQLKVYSDPGSASGILGRIAELSRLENYLVLFATGSRVLRGHRKESCHFPPLCCTEIACKISMGCGRSSVCRSRFGP